MAIISLINPIDLLYLFIFICLTYFALKLFNFLFHYYQLDESGLLKNLSSISIGEDIEEHYKELEERIEKLEGMK